MNKTIIKLFSYLLILAGLLALFLRDSGKIAGPFVLLGIIMIIESIWLEKWDADKKH